MAETPMETRIEDRTPSSAVPLVNGVGPSPARPEPDDDAERLRGIVALPHQRTILLIDEVELDTEKLPRWQPHIIIDERRLIDDGHE